MIFKIILSIRYRLEFKLLICFLVFSILSSVIGCTTTGSHLIKNDKLPSQIDYEILKVHMKNGQIIDMRGKSAHYVKEYEGKKNLIFYASTDTVQTNEDSLNNPLPEKIPDTIIDTLKGTMTVVPTIKIIELDSVRWVTIEKTEIDVGKTVLIVLAAVTLVILLYFLLDDNSGEDNDSDYEDYRRNENCNDCPDYNEYNNANISGKLLNQSPKNKSINIPRFVLLKWDYADSDAENLKFDIYADYQNPPETRIAKDISGKSFEMGMTTPGTKIYWQVVAKYNGKSISESPVWYFTTIK